MEKRAISVAEMNEEKTRKQRARAESMAMLAFIVVDAGAIFVKSNSLKSNSKSFKSFSGEAVGFITCGG
jgi:hypothetical protein